MGDSSILGLNDCCFHQVNEKNVVGPVRVKKSQEFTLGCDDWEMSTRHPRADVENVMRC